jgi:hypothetical protein
MSKRINTRRAALLSAVMLVASASTALAQPTDQPADPYADPPKDEPKDPDQAWPEPVDEEQPQDPARPRAPELGGLAGEADLTKSVEPRPERIRDEPPLLSPRAFNSQTARLLPAAVIYNSSGVDTSGGISSDLRVGLGDVAEFGLALNDQIRARPSGQPDNFDRVYPYFMAMFKLGVAEHRIFEHQPALAIAFRKSFERDDGGFKSRVAALEFVGSKSLGDKVHIHLGGVLWDAQIEAPNMEPVFLHDSETSRALRPFGAIEIEALDNASIMVEWTYNPHFVYDPANPEIGLTEQLAWGVRYQISKAVALESGVRVNDIIDADLIDAQIFGQLTFASYRVRNWIAGLR